MPRTRDMARTVDLALELLHRGAVHPLNPDLTLYLVMGTRPYLVALPEPRRLAGYLRGTGHTGQSCECDDWHYNRLGGCKHIIAARTHQARHQPDLRGGTQPS